MSVSYSAKKMKDKTGIIELKTNIEDQLAEQTLTHNIITSFI